MATIRVRLGSFEDEGAVIYMEYNNVTMRISAVVVENILTSPVYVALVRDSDRQIYSQIFQPGTTTLSIPTQAQGRFDITDLGRGRWGNLSLQMGYPAQ